MSSDLKSLWLLIKGRFKFVTDEFCPYCHIKKGQIEDHIRGTLKDKINYRVNLGYLDLPSMCFLFCILHARLRVTETILTHQIRATFDYSTKKTQCLKDWEALLQKLTNNVNIRVKSPQQGKEDRKFGTVDGLTGDLVDMIISG